MKKKRKQSIDFGTDKVHIILLKLAPPIMLAQLIQALYNIIDSLFIGNYSQEGLTALSIIYPVQLLMIALAVGTGVGINTLMAHFYGIDKASEAQNAAGVGTPLALIMWILFAGIGFLILPLYASVSTGSSVVIKQVTVYGRIISIGSIGLFCESIWTKILQSEGNMKTPMIAQMVGAGVNILLDPLFIWGFGVIPEMGIGGAAFATVIGQIAAAVLVFRNGYRKTSNISNYLFYIVRIYRLGFPNILMQSAYTFYILGLNLILKTFSDQAVTALGLYYKWQTFFFIPLGAMQTCIVPIISYNYAAGRYERCKKIVKTAIFIGWG